MFRWVPWMIVALIPFWMVDSRSPAPETGGPTDRINLGRKLFFAKELSEQGTTSCATCHRPEDSFTDGKADSVGQMGIGIGRNSPTLFGLVAISKFRDPGQTRYARPGREGRVLTLEERCLEPMKNELEMGARVEVLVKRLRASADWTREFERAFGGAPTAARLGEALAAYVRILEAPAESPYARYLAREQGALREDELRGLQIFEGKGQCNTCHSGPALSDGLMHVVDPPGGQRIRDRERLAEERKIELLRREIAARDPGELARSTPLELLKKTKEHAVELPGGGGYDASQLEVQTTTLWDVSRTAPYFRDGSVPDLRRAVEQHLQEMAEVARRPKEVAATLSALGKAGKRSAPSLRGRIASEIIELSPGEIDDLWAFLRALSVR